MNYFVMEASIEEVIQIREVRQHWVVLVVNAKRTLIRARNLRLPSTPALCALCVVVLVEEAA